MWGSDFPHSEGTFPFSREAVRINFADIRAGEAQMILGATAANLYGFDTAALAQAAARVGPRFDEIDKPLEVIPDEARRIATFDPHAVVRSW